MINVNELNACLARKGLSKSEGAKILGITPKTFYEWLDKAVMPTDKAEILIQKLDIKEPAKIFFNGELRDR